jgi:hypothetical protein
LFAIIVLVTIPASVHVITSIDHAARCVSPVARWYWTSMPVSVTIPYVSLALMFGLHCLSIDKTQSRRAAYCGAILAWSIMMWFSVRALCLSDSQIERVGPTGATLGLYLGPFFAIGYVIVIYAIGAYVGSLSGRFSRWREQRKQMRPGVQ